MGDHLARHLHFNHRHAEARRLAHSRGELPNLDLDLDLPTSVLAPEPTKIFVREDSAATASCTSDSQAGCVLPTDTTTNTGVIIGVSVALPLALALILLVVLHRRVTKRQAAEDAKDAQADLDFGVDPKYRNTSAGKGRAKKGGRAGPEMTATDLGFEKELRKGHHVGISMDLGNPYILPAAMNGSRDSLHSLTRSLTDRHDPYSAIGQAPSIRGFGAGDAGSIRSGSEKGLLANPQPNPLSRSQSPLAPLGQRPPSLPAGHNELPGSQPGAQAVTMPTFDFTDHSTTDVRPESENVRLSVDVATANADPRAEKSGPTTPPPGALHHPARGASLIAGSPNNNSGPVDPYEFKEVVVPPSPDAADGEKEKKSVVDASTFPHPPPPEPGTDTNRMTLGLGLDLSGNRISVLRPLPPDDPNDTAESRANRIRSFYKEYFSDDAAHVHDADPLSYYEDYGDEYLQDGAIFDPVSGQFIVAQAPYADPITRRAMTPPPRGPPQKFRGGPRRPGPPSSGSSPGVGGPRGRAYSSASYARNGSGGPRGRGPAKRPLPPPAALRNLPTPHLLQEDAFNMTMEFAPPRTYRDRQAGRPESPYLGEKPYSPPTVPTSSPLVSAFTELAAVPSPHMLRKSGTFTGLDFALPPKIKDRDGAGSDAGSIRSGKSNFSAVSARQQHNIRAGAYRLSRVPKDLVGTKNDIMDSLKPTFKMGS